MAFDPISALFEVGGKLIDKLIPDPQAKAQAQLELAKMQETGELARMANETETLKEFLADTQSARSRDIAIVQAGRKNYRADILAYMAVGALCSCILLLFVFKVPQESRDLLLVVLGALVAIVKDVFGFEFGSSKDSQRNAQAVADMLKNGS
jgi:hypothetical protein